MKQNIAGFTGIDLNLLEDFKMKAIERIIANLPKNEEHRENALIILLSLVRGDSVHVYNSWTNNFRRLTKATGVSQTITALNAAGVSFDCGNDAPRGGVLGDFIKLSRRMPSAVPVIEAEMAAIRARWGY